MRFLRLILGAFGILAFTSGAIAEAQPVRFGGQITIVKPQGDLGENVDEKAGFGGGVNLLIDLKNGHAIVPRVEYLQFKNSKSYNTTLYTSSGYIVPGTETDEIKVNVLNIGADYNYYFSKKTGEGFYLSGGVFYSKCDVNYSETLSAPGYISKIYKTNFSGDGFGASVGAGCMFTENVGMEVKYSTVDYSMDRFDDGSAPTVGVSLIVRF